MQKLETHPVQPEPSPFVPCGGCYPSAAGSMTSFEKFLTVAGFFIIFLIHLLISFLQNRYSTGFLDYCKQLLTIFAIYWTCRFIWRQIQTSL